MYKGKQHKKHKENRKCTHTQNSIQITVTQTNTASVKGSADLRFWRTKDWSFSHVLSATNPTNTPVWSRDQSWRHMADGTGGLASHISRQHSSMWTCSSTTGVGSRSVGTTAGCWHTDRALTGQQSMLKASTTTCPVENNAGICANDAWDTAVAGPVMIKMMIFISLALSWTKRSWIQAWGIASSGVPVYSPAFTGTH